MLLQCKCNCKTHAESMRKYFQSIHTSYTKDCANAPFTLSARLEAVGNYKNELIKCYADPCVGCNPFLLSCLKPSSWSLIHRLLQYFQVQLQYSLWETERSLKGEGKVSQAGSEDEHRWSLVLWTLVPCNLFCPTLELLVLRSLAFKGK